jgi:2,3-bisphosphoglycerate-independent phosphoglycerate mutase
MEDFTAGHISSDEGARLIQALDNTGEGLRLYPGVSYRNLLVLDRGKGAETTPPHDIVGMPVDPHLPLGWDGPILRRAMERSREIFSDHDVNRARIRQGKRPATLIWPWSGGRRPALPPFRERYGLSAGIIAAVDLLNGIARYAGMEVIRVPGATGYLDTDYQAKARYAVEALRRMDFLYLHVEAPDEAGHMGSVEEKVRAIERVDGMVGTIMESFEGVIAVLPDHPTPIRVKTHTTDPVPFAVRGLGQDDTRRLTEREAARGAFGLMEAAEFLPMLFSAAISRL